MDNTTINRLSNFVKLQRQKARMTQEELAQRAGVGLRFIRDLEQGKESLRLDKVNQVLSLFGHSAGAVNEKSIDIFQVMLQHMNQAVKIHLKNGKELYGIILEYLTDYSMGNDAWKFVSNNHAIAYHKNGDDNLTEIIPNSAIDDIENITK